MGGAWGAAGARGVGGTEGADGAGVLAAAGRVDREGAVERAADAGESGAGDDSAGGITAPFSGLPGTLTLLKPSSPGGSGKRYPGLMKR